MEIEKQIFIGGCRRSGTTMLGSIIGAHNTCICTPESINFILDGLGVLNSYNSHNKLDVVIKHILKNWRFKLWELKIDLAEVPWGDINDSYPRLIEWIASQYGNKIGKSHTDTWVDHSPGNFSYALTLLNLYPNARFIHIVRDGRAIASSIMPLDWGPNTIIRTAEWWVRGTAYGLALETLLPKEKIIRVKFEDLVSYPEKTVLHLCNFLNIDFQKNMILANGFIPPNYTLKQHSLVGKEPDQTRISNWETSLSPRQIEIFERLTHEFLLYLGYPLRFGLRARPPTIIEKFVSISSELFQRGVKNKINNYKRRSSYLD
jgi:hypothetical protein